MNDSIPSVLSRVTLGHAPVIGRERTVFAERVTVYVEGGGAPDAAALVAALARAWPVQPGAAGGAAGAGAAGEGAAGITLRDLGGVAGGPGTATSGPAAPAARPAPGTLPPLVINAAHEGLLAALLAAPPVGAAIEVPAFIAGDAAHAPSILAAAASGTPLVLKGRPLAPLPAAVVGAFGHIVLEAGEDRRTGGPLEPGARRMATLQAGVQSAAEVGDAFERGAAACTGWPLVDPLPAAGGARKAAPPDVQAILELIDGVERVLPPPRLEASLKKDPGLAFRLLRYINSPAFGLSVEVTSFAHALMLLGHQRLKRWLALLLASAGKGANSKPLMHAAVRRGLLMEELAKAAGGDGEVRGEMFICGVFSLLDQLLRQPFADLAGALPVPERVRAALLEGAGPFEPALTLVRALESAQRADIEAARERLLLGTGEVNAALLAALAGARALD
jgi:EAL and modified HD-GYP domain-containing signal transduction protein